jgi:ABC-2 type transport system ATP-binding protein
MDKSPALKIKEVAKSFRNHEALKGVDVDVNEGRIFGLLGPNGAGKTTLIRMLTGITAPDSGSISFFGSPLTREHISQIGYLPEERGLYKSMRVGEQALYFARLRGMQRNEAETRLRFWFEKLEVEGWWNREVADLSKGMAQKVQFIISVLHQPRLLILDEPFSGFDPINAQRVRDAVIELKEKQGTTILLSTHDMGSVEELCDEVALLNRGEVLLEGPVEALREKAREGRFTLRFRGTVMEFTVAIGASAELIQVLDSNSTVGEHEVMMRLAADQDIASWLHWISGQIPVISCSPWQPSMRDIFIQTVEQRESKQMKP